jgi:hypothetical protein
MYSEDVDPQSGYRLPLPKRGDLVAAGQRIYDSLTDPTGKTLKGLSYSIVPSCRGIPDR